MQRMKVASIFLAAAVALGSLPTNIYGEEIQDKAGNEENDVSLQYSDVSLNTSSITTRPYASNVITFISPLEKTEYSYEYKLGLQRLLEDFPKEIMITAGGSATYQGENLLSVQYGSSFKIPADWRCQEDYDNELGTYHFYPTLEGYLVSEEASVPIITVTVFDESDGAVSDYIEMDPGYEVPIPERTAMRGALYATAYDNAYNAYEEDLLPEVRNQGSEGACWSFASLGSMEAELIKSGRSTTNINLSELQLAYFSTHPFTDPKNLHSGDSVTYQGTNYLSNGGNPSIAYRFLGNKVGAVEEKYVPYSKGSSYVPNERFATSMDAYQIKNAYEIAIEDKTGIKQAILNYGGVAASYWASAGTTTYEEDSTVKTGEARYSATYNSFYGTVKKMNHAVMLVGWDDNFPKENFYSTLKPSSDGAWLVRNSWGLDDYGKNGYFWLSYEDASLLYSESVIAFDGDSTVYDHCYSYDYQPGISVVYNIDEGKALTQTYPVNGGEEIKAVSFETGSANTDVTVSVTAAGDSAIGSVSTVYAGLYTVTLDHGIKVDSDTTATVSITTEGGGGSSKFLFEKTGDANVNRLRYTGAHDALNTAIDGSSIPYDARIKLFTDETSHLDPVTIEVMEPEIIDYAGTTHQIRLTESSTVSMSDLTWTATDESIAKVSSTGLITVGNKKGSTAIIGTANGYYVTVTVQVKPYNLQYSLEEDVKYNNLPSTYYPGDTSHCSLPKASQVGRAGYTLSGWYYLNEGEKVQVTNTSLSALSGDLTLYPIWKANSLAINYYEPQSDLTVYTDTTRRIGSTTADEMPYVIPEFSDLSYDPNEDAVSYNRTHPAVYFIGFSLNPSGEVTPSIDKETGYALTKVGTGKAATFTQNTSIELYPLYSTAIDGGSCGDNLCWVITEDGQNGFKLSIYGNGAMDSFASSENVPWKDYTDTVKSVHIGENVSSISAYAFDSFINLTEIQFPLSVRTVGESALNGCDALKSVTSEYASITLPNKNGSHWVRSGQHRAISSIRYATAERVSEYSITYIANGGSGSISTVYCSLNDTYSIPECTFTYTGHTFVEWNTSAGGDGTSYQEGQEFSNLKEDGEVLYLYAIWKLDRIAVNSVTLSKTSISIQGDETYTLTPTIIPSNATNQSVTWESSAPAIATVDNGVIRGAGNGVAIITVHTVDGDKTATCRVTVSGKEIRVTGVSLSKNSLSLEKGEKTTLTASISPNNATNQEVTWESRDTSVATVSGGIVTAAGEGSTYIDVTTTDGGYKASCLVTVKEADPNVPPEEDPVTPEKGDPDDDTDGKTGIWTTGVNEAYAYSGSVIKPEPRVYYDDKKLTIGVDYNLTYKNNTKVGTGTIIVTLKGNYSGKETISFSIVQRDLSTVTANNISALTKYRTVKGEKVYTVQKLLPVLTYNGKTLRNKVDYTLSYPDTAKEAYAKEGSYDIVATGIGSFKGSVTVSEILRDKGSLQNLSTARVTMTGIVSPYDPAYPVHQNPTYVLKTSKGALIDSSEYTVTYTNNVNPGTATVTFTANEDGSYYGTKKTTFQIKNVKLSMKDEKIQAKLAESTIPYAKGGAKPQAIVKDYRYTGGKTLVEGVDYTVSYKYNTQVNGRYQPTAVIRGKGNYTNYIELPFTITKQNLSNVTFAVSTVTFQAKTGAFRTASLTAFDQDGKALSTADYKIQGADIVRSDSAAVPSPGSTVIIYLEAKSNNYTGTAEAFYTVTNTLHRITNAQITFKDGGMEEYDALRKGFIYHGSAVTPDSGNMSITLTIRGEGLKTLEYGEDYEIVAYQTNEKAGTGKMILQGIGEYSGLKTVNFKIVPYKI